MSCTCTCVFVCCDEVLSQCLWRYVGLCVPVHLSLCGPLGRYVLCVCYVCPRKHRGTCEQVGVGMCTCVCTSTVSAVPRAQSQPRPCHSEPALPPFCPQGCYPRAWSSALLLTTTRCVKATTPPSGTGLRRPPKDWGPAPSPSVRKNNPDLRHSPAPSRQERSR